MNHTLTYRNATYISSFSYFNYLVMVIILNPHPCVIVSVIISVKNNQVSLIGAAFSNH